MWTLEFVGYKYHMDHTIEKYCLGYFWEDFVHIVLTYCSTWECKYKQINGMKWATGDPNKKEGKIRINKLKSKRSSRIAEAMGKERVTEISTK